VRGNVACDKRVAVLQGIAPHVLFKQEKAAKTPVFFFDNENQFAEAYF